MRVISTLNLSFFLIFGGLALSAAEADKPEIGPGDRLFGHSQKDLEHLVENRHSLILDDLRSGDPMSIHQAAEMVSHHLTKPDPDAPGGGISPPEDIAIVLDGAIPLLFQALDLELYETIESEQPERMDALRNEEGMMRVWAIHSVMDALIQIRLYLEEQLALEQVKPVREQFSKWKLGWDRELARCLEKTSAPTRVLLKKSLLGKITESERRTKDVVQRSEAILLEAEALDPTDSLPNLRALMLLLENSDIPLEVKAPALLALKNAYVSARYVYLNLEDAIENVEELRADFKYGIPELIAMQAPFELSRLDRLRELITDALTYKEADYQQMMGLLQHAPEASALSTIEQEIQERGQKIRAQEVQFRIAALEGRFDSARKILEAGEIDAPLMLRRLARLGKNNKAVRKFVKQCLQ